MFETQLNAALQNLLRCGSLNQGRPGNARMENFSQEKFDLPIREREQLGKRRLIQDVTGQLVNEGIAPESIKTSVSHTSLNTDSWVVVVGSDRSLGVDLEAVTRKVHPQVLFRVSSEKEREKLGWSALQYWVVKEAAFKSNPNNQGTVISQYSIIAWDESQKIGEIQTPSGQTQGLACRFTLLELGSWYIALAESHTNP